MLIYPYGTGIVLLTTVHEDISFSQNLSTMDGVRLVRDIIEWAKAESKGQDISSYEAGSTAIIPLTITAGPTVSGAESININMYDPDGNLASTLNLPISLGPSETKTLSIEYAPTTLGIWSIDYELLDVDGNIIQTGYDTAKFAVKGGV
jgi:hypothetical protein